ncbi:MAG: hypothetical protein AAGJ28_11170 [Pseudomonadota bacterium]
MKYFAPFAALALIACDAPLEELHPREAMILEHDGAAYSIITQYDALDRSWFARIGLVDARLEKSDRAAALRVFKSELGPKLCDGAELAVDEDGGLLWGQGAKTIHYLETYGEWQIHGDCA